MTEQTYNTLREMEVTADHVYHKVHQLLHSDAKMSICDLQILTDIMKDCSETFKNVHKVMHSSKESGTFMKI